MVDGVSGKELLAERTSLTCYLHELPNHVNTYFPKKKISDEVGVCFGSDEVMGYLGGRILMVEFIY